MLDQLWFPIVLQILGIVVIIAEFILPSGGLLTIAAVGLIGYSLYDVFAGISITAGLIFVAADIVLLPFLILIGFKILARSPIALRSELSRSLGVSSQDELAQQLLGKTGKTLTDLRPSGKALIDNKRLDVVSSGDYIAHDMPIKVYKVDGNRIVVKSLE
ncbi:MAG: NfeD family protein [Chitinivibrionales bacterium]